MPTIGVALAIPEPWAQDLQDYRTSIGDLTALKIPTHITLVPPVEVGEASMGMVEDHLDRVAEATPGFRIHLRGTGTFRPVSPVVFVAVAVGISQCEQLASKVRRGPLEADLQFPYHPHVTIGHHLSDAALDRAFDELATFECRFEAREFQLYVHGDATGWQPSRQFALRAPSAQTLDTRR